MLIFGARNYLKSDSDYRLDLCGQCNRLGQLHSYSAMQFGHLYYLPILPMGKKRIVEQCPHCKARGEMPISKWRDLRDHEIPKAITSVQSIPTDRGTAEQALGITSSFGDEASFREAMKAVQPHYANDPKMLVQMGIGLNRFQKSNEAQAMWQKSLSIQEDQNVRDLASFHASSTTPPIPSPPSKLGQWLPLLILPLILCGLLLMGLFVGASAKPQNAYLLNGLGTDYNVQLNGDKIPLIPGRLTLMPVDFGTVNIEPVPGETYPFTFDPVQIKVKKGSFLGGGDVFVVNPDKTAVIEEGTAVYYNDEKPIDMDDLENEPVSTYYTGKTAYQLPKVDHIFQPPPPRLEAMTTDKTKKSYLRLVEGSPAEKCEALLMSGDQEGIVALARNSLNAEPNKDTETMLALMMGMGDEQETMKFLEAGLDEEPLRVDWHRVYQNMKEDENPEAIRAEYEKRLAANPKSADLTYLLARLLDDEPARQRSLFEKSTTISPPSAYGHYALAHGHFVSGEFKAADAQLDRALKLVPEDPKFKERKLDCTMALGQWTDVVNSLDTAERNKESLPEAVRLSTAYAAAGQTEKAMLIKSEWIAKINSMGNLPPEATTMLNATFDIGIAAASGRTDTYKRLIATIDRPQWQFLSALANNDIGKAANLVEIPDEFGTTDRLILYSAAKMAGKPTVALAQLKAMTEEGRAGIGHDVSELFGSKPPPVSAMSSNPLVAIEPAASWLAMAAHHGKGPHKAKYLELAKKMNYTPTVQKPVIDQLIDMGSKQ